MPRTEPIPAQRLAASLRRQDSAHDWRQELRQLATWAHPPEAPAGAGRYPIALPEGRQRDDLPQP